MYYKYTKKAPKHQVGLPKIWMQPYILISSKQRSEWRTPAINTYSKYYIIMHGETAIGSNRNRLAIETTIETAGYIDHIYNTQHLAIYSYF